MAKKVRTYIYKPAKAKKPINGVLKHTTQKLSRRDGWIELDLDCCGNLPTTTTTSTTTTTTTAAPTTTTTSTTTTTTTT